MATTPTKSNVIKLDLQSLLKARLAESDLSSEHAKKLRVEALSAEQVAKLGHNFDHRPGVRIPYFDPKGNTTKFFRLRYLGAPTGFAASSKKAPRYVQPANTLNEVYLPPLLDCSWEELLADTSVPLYFTEGEFKSACACSKDIPVIGLGGVDVFRASKRGFPELLPVLEDTAWKGREVAIIWDSDVGTKPDALRAQRKLAYELTRRGAIPKLLALPPGPDGKKMGLDDYLCVHEPEDLRAMVAEATAYDEATHLWAMNEEVVLVMNSPPVIVVRKSGKLITPKDFTSVVYADRKYTVRVPKGDGDTKTVIKSTAKEWLEWPQRFTVDALTYAPGQPQITDKGEWNCWKGWGVVPREGDVQPFLDLINFIFTGQPEVKDWFLKWAAYPIQHPGQKLFSAVLIWGAFHGTGKTLLGYTLRDIYGENATTIGDEQLHASFNEWARNKQFVIGEEITGSDKRQDANRLKALITQERILINAKYLPVIQIPDCINYYLTSNESNALFLQDSDRRVMVHEVVGPPADHPDSKYGDPELYIRYDKWRKAGGAAALMWYLMTQVDTSDFRPEAPALRTSSKEEMIIDNKTEIARWVYELKTDPIKTLAPIGNTKASLECDLYTPTQLFGAFNPMNDNRRGSIAGLSRELKQAGFAKPGRGNPIQTKVGMNRFWIVRNEDKWVAARPAECAAHWEKYWVGATKY